MPYKYADARYFPGLIKKEYSQIEVKDKDYNGYVALVKALEVDKPYINDKGDKYFDKGYFMLQFFFNNKKYMVTTMFDENENIVEYYIDVIRNVYVEEDGVPYQDDLYLDVIYSYKTKQTVVKDEDELEEAYDMNKISDEEYNMAIKMAELMEEELKKEETLNYLELMSKKYLKELKPSLK